MSEDVRTYRGRNLAEILPRIREELGEDAVVLRRREGLAGGVGGFFAKAFIEVEARAGGARIDIRDDEPAEPAAAAASPASPAIAGAGGAADVADAIAAFAAATEPAAAAAPALGAPAAPVQDPAAGSGFARLLADAYARGFGTAGEEPAAPVAGDGEAPSPAERFLADLAPAAPETPSPAERFLADLAAAAPQAGAEQPAAAAHAPAGAFLADLVPASRGAAVATAAAPASLDRVAAPAPVVPDYVPRELERAALPALAAAENHAAAEAAPAGREDVEAQPVHRTKAAQAARQALEAGGCSPSFAGEVVAEATAHGLPFASPRSLRRLVREALVRRLPAAPPRGEHAVVALVGPAGSGRTTAAGRLAAAYAAGSDLTVCAVALRAGDGGLELAGLAPGCTVTAANAADAAAAVSAAGSRALVVLDAPPVSARDAAGIQALRRELRTAGATEVHVVLPATIGAAAARALIAAVRPLRPSAILVTHAEDAAGAGALLEVAATEGLALVWQSTSAALGPADPAALAGEVLR